MEKFELRLNILLSLQRALLCNISSHVRMICCDWDGNKWFKIRFYLDVEPNDGEKELMSVVLTEFGNDIQFEKFYEECIYSVKPISDLLPLKVVVYMRHEGKVF